MEQLDYEQMNGLSLAYIGDAIYELAVRNHLVSLGLTKVNDLQKNHGIMFRRKRMRLSLI